MALRQMGHSLILSPQSWQVPWPHMKIIFFRRSRHTGHIVWVEGKHVKWAIPAQNCKCIRIYIRGVNLWFTIQFRNNFSKCGTFDFNRSVLQKYWNKRYYRNNYIVFTESIKLEWILIKATKVKSKWLPSFVWLTLRTYAAGGILDCCYFKT